MSNRYTEMKVRRCGESGVRLPELSLGLWHGFGGDADITACQKMIFTAFDHGIYHFDLANNYGPPPGSAETMFGKILGGQLGAHRDELFISTKAGYLMWDGPFGEWGSRKGMLASLDQSLKRLQLPYVDLFYSHRFDPDTPLEETMGALAHAVRQGKALYAGISNYPAEATRNAIRILHDMGIRCLIHQQRYNLLERQCETTLFPVLESEKVGMIAFSPLAQGMLTSRYLSGIPSDSRAAGSSVFLNPERVNLNHAKICAFQEIAQERGQTLAQMALAWILRGQTPVSSALIGASRPEQILENLKALDNIVFSQEETDAINAVITAP